VLGERGINVVHCTIYRWIQRYAAEIEKLVRWYWKPLSGYKEEVVETYTKVKD